MFFFLDKEFIEAYRRTIKSKMKSVLRGVLERLHFAEKRKKTKTKTNANTIFKTITWNANLGS